MHPDTVRYNNLLAKADQRICDLLAREIDRVLPEAENRIWHAHPVWFLDGNPVVGYSKLKDCVRLLFWSGQSFEEEGLKDEGSFKAAEARYTAAGQINAKDLRRWLAKARDIQWDYKNIVRRKGRLQRIIQPGIGSEAKSGGKIIPGVEGKRLIGKTSPCVDERIRSLGGWRAEVLAEVRRMIHQADPEILEECKWKKPGNPQGVPVWSHAGIVCTGEAYKQVVKLTFARGAFLEDPRGLFNSSLEGNMRRAIDIREGDMPAAPAFKALIRAAVAENLRFSTQKSRGRGR
jgi:hypothetical protein